MKDSDGQCLRFTLYLDCLSLALFIINLEKKINHDSTEPHIATHCTLYTVFPVLFPFHVALSFYGSCDYVRLFLMESGLFIFPG